MQRVRINQSYLEIILTYLQDNYVQLILFLVVLSFTRFVLQRICPLSVLIYWRVCSRCRLKTLWQKDKLLAMSLSTLLLVDNLYIFAQMCSQLSSAGLLYVGKV